MADGVSEDRRVKNDYRKKGVETRLKHQAESRQEQESALLMKDDISKEKFDECRFVTQLVEFAFTRTGDVLVKLRVPYIYRHQAAKLQNAYGVMLECDLQRWSQELEARREANG
jgi:hypothetical protein